MPHRSDRKIGLARALSKLGYCSRSRATELIRAGRVTQNGRTRRDPETPVHSQDRLAVDGQPVDTPAKIYLMLNKPRGVITTASDEKGRKTVYDLLKNDGNWLAPVGRLDKASEGLLLLTNDSEWGARIAAPGTHLDKTYHVQVATVAEEEFLRALMRGVSSQGELLRAKSACLLRAGEKNCWLEIVLDEGRNRHIRRMLETLHIEVLRLVRVAIGPLLLGTLAQGDFRPLTITEKRMLDRAMTGKQR
ncbi:MAG TPA: pseudouridine synthase [Candidatus Binatia bacterium]|nr:pseudouridine synthase [Candidatus Binatia bacterium]